MPETAAETCVDKIRLAKLWEIGNLLAIYASNICSYVWN